MSHAHAKKIVKAVLSEAANPAKYVCLLTDVNGDVAYVVDSENHGILGVEDALQEAGLSDDYTVNEVGIFQLQEALDDIKAAKAAGDDDGLDLLDAVGDEDE